MTSVPDDRLRQCRRSREVYVTFPRHRDDEVDGFDG